MPKKHFIGSSNKIFILLRDTEIRESQGSGFFKEITNAHFVFSMGSKSISSENIFSIGNFKRFFYSRNMMIIWTLLSLLTVPLCKIITEIKLVSIELIWFSESTMLKRVAFCLSRVFLGDYFILYLLIIPNIVLFISFFVSYVLLKLFSFDSRSRFSFPV